MFSASSVSKKIVCLQELKFRPWTSIEWGIREIAPLDLKGYFYWGVSGVLLALFVNFGISWDL